MGTLSISDRIERIFRDLSALMREGKFTRRDLDAMEAFLTVSLNATKSLRAKIAGTTISKEVSPDINNELLYELSVDNQCPNCGRGVIEQRSKDVYVCTGNCKAYFRPPGYFTRKERP